MRKKRWHGHGAPSDRYVGGPGQPRLFASREDRLAYDPDGDSPEEDQRISVVSALSSGLFFALGRPFTVLRVSLLPMITLFGCAFLFWAYHMPYMILVPGQFLPADWAVAAAVVFAFLLALASLWGGLFQRFFSPVTRHSWHLLALGGQKLRLMSAFALLIALPILFFAVWHMLADWGYASRLVSVDLGPKPASFLPAPIHDSVGNWLPNGTLSENQVTALASVAALWVVYMLFRLIFLVPDVVMQRRFRPIKAWGHSRSTIWSLLLTLCLALPVLLMLLGGPTTAGIFATYYLYPELSALDVRVSLSPDNVDQLIKLWPTLIGFMAGLSFCCAFWAGTLGALYQARIGDQWVSRDAI